MDAGLVRIVAAGVLAAHGLGHALGWMPAWGLAAFDGVSSRSWVLTGVLGDGAARAVGGALFLLPMAGFIAAAVGLLLGQPWWRQAALVSATLSLTATALYPQAFTPGATAGSVVVDVAVLYGLLVAGWGSEAATI
jgi:hypothetical protein